MRAALGSPHLDSRPGGGADRERILELSSPDLAVATAAIDDADALLVIGTDPLHAAPILDLRIRKAVRRNGTALAVAGDRPTALDGGALALARYTPGGAAAFLAELDSALAAAKEGTKAEGDAGEVAALLSGAERPLIVWGERLARGDGGAAAVDALLELARGLGCTRTEGAGLLGVPDTANGRGLREVGLLPDAGPGLTETEPGMDSEAIRAALESDDLQALILFGADPVRDHPDSAGWQQALRSAGFVLAFSMFEDASTALADVVLPLQSHAEKEGTVTHPDGRLQRVRPNVMDPGEVRPGWEVLCELAAALGHETGICSAPEVLAALASDAPIYRGITEEEIGGRGVRWQERDAASALPAANLVTDLGEPATPQGGPRAGCSWALTATSGRAR